MYTRVFAGHVSSKSDYAYEYNNQIIQSLWCLRIERVMDEFDYQALTLLYPDWRKLPRMYEDSLRKEA